MNFKKWAPVIYPLVFWLCFKGFSFLLGFTSVPNITELELIGGAYPFIASLGFGLWIGAASSKDFTMFEAIRNATVIAFLVGFVELAFTMILINNSASFVTYITAVYPTQVIGLNIPFQNFVVSTWIYRVFIIVPVTAAAYCLMDRKKKR